MNTKNLNEELVVDSYAPNKEEGDILDFVKKRQDEMKHFRTQSKIEDIWREADNEYIPHELDVTSTRKKFEQNQDTGERSRMVRVGGDDNEWRSNNAAPTLLVKIQTALATIIDSNPEAVLVPLSRMFEKTTLLAYSIWKRNWEISGSKENLKKFVFNLFKYGWAIGRTYPLFIKYKKSVLTEVDVDKPENNVYKDKELIWYNDIAKDNLNPYRTWIDENTKPYDPYSTNDCYFELDYSYDQAEIEFGMYENWKYVPKNARVTYEEEKDTEGKERKDIITIGIYENRTKDMFVITVPKIGLLLHSCPIPNDDGYLDIWHTFLLFRSATNPMGISMWQIIMQDKALFDKWDNMTADQLTLSIMKFGFYTGTSSVLGDGVIKIEPGKARQAINGKMDWMEIPGPGKDAYEGLKMMEARMDSNTGLSPTLEGDITGKTLGEIQLARESSLKRLKTPLENIAYAIEQDAYLTLSWAKQIYSTPEIKEFANEDELHEYEEERGIENGGIQEKIGGGVTAQYYPELSLHLEDREGKLFESEESKFFQIGKDIMAKDLNWRGIFKVIPKSLVGNSEIIDQQTKMQMFNLLVPLFQMPPEIAKKPAIQILKVNHEEPKDWLPDAWLVEEVPGMEEEVPPEEDLFVEEEATSEQTSTGAGPINGQTVKGKAGIAPNGLQTMVPKGQAPGMQMKEVTGGVGQFINKMFK